MERSRTKIQSIVHVIHSRRRELLAVVQHEDGTYGITLDGRAVDCFIWRSDQLQDCLDTLYIVAERPRPQHVTLTGPNLLAKKPAWPGVVFPPHGPD